MKKPRRKSSLAGIYSKLPEVNVEFASNTDAGEMTPKQVRGMICNPIYVGMGAYPQIVDDEEWVRASAKMIREEGKEQYLVNMLYVLRKSLEVLEEE